MDNLRSCPRCGNNNISVGNTYQEHWEIDSFDKTVDYGYFVVCDVCQLSTKIFYDSKYLEPRVAAVSEWNKISDEFETDITEKHGFYPPYPIVALCGSTKFEHAFNHWSRFLTLLGCVVNTVSVFLDKRSSIYAKVKNKLDQIHFQKIQMSSDVIVLNIDNYIGLSTWDEIFFSLANKKNVYFIEPFNNKCLLDFYDFTKSEGANVLTYSNGAGIVGIEFEQGQIGDFIRNC